jgi:hypothetical protein
VRKARRLTPHGAEHGQARGASHVRRSSASDARLRRRGGALRAAAARRRRRAPVLAGRVTPIRRLMAARRLRAQHRQMLPRARVAHMPPSSCQPAGAAQQQNGWTKPVWTAAPLRAQHRRPCWRNRCAGEARCHRAARPAGAWHQGFQSHAPKHALLACQQLKQRWQRRSGAQPAARARAAPRSGVAGRAGTQPARGSMRRRMRRGTVASAQRCFRRSARRVGAAPFTRARAAGGRGHVSRCSAACCRLWQIRSIRVFSDPQRRQRHAGGCSMARLPVQRTAGCACTEEAAALDL